MIDRYRLEQIIREAAYMAMRSWPGEGHEVESWEKSPGNPVCAADLAVDSFLKRELGALLPAAGWLSEETADDMSRLDKHLCWLVDPIDGTRDYLRGRSGWAVSVALVSGGRPLMGFLSAPARREDWSAIAGRGAWLNGEPIRVSGCARLSGARVPADHLAKEYADLRLIPKPNSIALRMAMVAAGQADLVATQRRGYEWDIAAATLIVREAGGIVTNVLGETLNFNKRDPRALGVLASAPKIHRAAVQRLAHGLPTQ